MVCFFFLKEMSGGLSTPVANHPSSTAKLTTGQERGFATGQAALNTYPQLEKIACNLMKNML